MKGYVSKKDCVDKLQKITLFVFCLLTHLAGLPKANKIDDFSKKTNREADCNSCEYQLLP